METEYINADEIAQFLRIARVTVYSLAKKGVIPQEIKMSIVMSALIASQNLNGLCSLTLDDAENLTAFRL